MVLILIERENFTVNGEGVAYQSFHIDKKLANEVLRKGRVPIMVSGIKQLVSEPSYNELLKIWEDTDDLGKLPEEAA